MNQREPARLPADTRDRIIDAAAYAFSRDGFRATTIRRIATIANVNDVTIFRYFPRKQDLYWLALDWKIQNSGLPEIIRTQLEQSPSPSGLIEGLVASILAAVTVDPFLPRLVQFALLELDEERRMLDRLYFQPMLKRLIGRMHSWIAEGKLRNVDPIAAGNAIIGLLLMQWSEFISPSRVQDENQVLEERAKQCADLCVRGLVD